MVTEIPENNVTVRLRIHDAMDAMSNGERKVARALLAQYPSAALTTVTELASRAGVSAPTVIRFVNRLGLGGFPALQRALVREINEQGSPLRQYAEQKVTESEPASILFKTQNAFQRTVRATYEELPESEFRALIRVLSDPKRRLFVTGGRFSRLLAEYTALHLQLLRPGVVMVAPEDMAQRTAIADADSSTVLLVFDYRRYTRQNLRLAERVHQRGATICLMTDNWLSPISAMAKVVLPSHVDGASPFDSLTAATALAESVIAGVYEELGDVGMKRVALAEESIEAP